MNARQRARESWWQRMQPILNKELGWFGLPVPPSAAQIIERAGLPAEASALVQRVVKRTRLRRGEKRDVARELCGHFLDGIESGAEVSELIRLFGDEKAAAKLIRRGKLRNRGIFWKSWVAMRWGALGVVGVFLCAYVIFAVRLALSERVISHDYLAEFNAPALAVPEEERGWTILQPALPVLEDWQLYSDRDPRENVYAAAIDARPGDPYWNDAVAFLQEHQEAIETIRRAAEARKLAFVAQQAEFALGDATTGDALVDGSLLGVLLPHLGACRKSAQLLYLDARHAVDVGDADTFVRDILAMRKLAVGSAEYPVLIAGLVGIAINSMADQAMSAVLLERPRLLSDGQWTSLAHGAAAVSARALLRPCVAGERAWFFDVVQRIYTDDGRGDGLLDLGAMQALMAPLRSPPVNGIHPLPSRAPGLGPLAAIVLPSRAEMVRAAERIYQMIEHQMQAPKWEWSDVDIDSEVEALVEGPVNQVRYELIGILLPSFGHAAAYQERAAQKEEAVQTAVALELYRRAHGDWPARLEALVPEFVPSSPLDTFTGQTLGYVVRNGQPILYSIGCDLVDNGGVLGEGRWTSDVNVGAWISRERREELRMTGGIAEVGDWILWPPQKN